VTINSVVTHVNGTLLHKAGFLRVDSMK